VDGGTLKEITLDEVVYRDDISFDDKMRFCLMLEEEIYRRVKEMLEKGEVKVALIHYDYKHNLSEEDKEKLKKWWRINKEKEIVVLVKRYTSVTAYMSHGLAKKIVFESGLSPMFPSANELNKAWKICGFSRRGSVAGIGMLLLGFPPTHSAEIVEISEKKVSEVIDIRRFKQ